MQRMYESHELQGNQIKQSYEKLASNLFWPCDEKRNWNDQWKTQQRKTLRKDVG